MAKDAAVMTFITRAAVTVVYLDGCTPLLLEKRALVGLQLDFHKVFKAHGHLDEPHNVEVLLKMFHAYLIAFKGSVPPVETFQIACKKGLIEAYLETLKTCIYAA